MKDSEALVLERNRITKLTTENTKMKETLEDLQSGYKDASRRLKKADADVVVLTAARDEFKEKSEELDLSYQKCKIDLKEYIHKETLASDINAEFQESNAKFRALWTEHEQSATDFRGELAELKKKLEVMK